MRRAGRTGRCLVLAIALLAAACSDGAGDRAPLPAAFDDGVPAPTEAVVLTVTTADDVVDWDLATLARLDQRELTIVEPFVEEEHTYRGPLWADVLRASGVDLDAGTTVELVALDDYVLDLATDPATLDGIVLAHREDGDPIPIADGGPIRLVLPPDNPASENPNTWIWSIRTARVL